MLLGLISAISAIFAFLICLFQNGFQGFSWLWLLPVCFFGAFLALLILWVLIVVIMNLLVDVSKPQKKDNPLYRTVIHWTADALITLLRIRIKTEGTEKLPKDGRFLLVCNHLFDVDPVVLMTVFRKSKLAFVSKQENLRKFIIGPFLHRILCQPLNRENDREALKTILKCVEILKEDKASVGVFAEGYIYADHLLHPLRPGVFKIAQKANVPVVVCTLRNTHNILPNAKKFKPTQVDVHLVDVIPAEALKGVPTVQIAKRAHDSMARDLGPELVLPEETT